MPLALYLRNGIWHYRGTVAGRRLRGSTKASRENRDTAQQVAAAVEARAWKGHLHGPEAVLTFAQAATLYRAARKPTRFLARVEDHWQDTLVRAITPGAVRQSCHTLYPDASAATWNRQVIVPTQAIINHAAESGLCPKISIARFKVPKVEKTPATWGWVRAFMAHANPHLGALACFMFLTGARISEATSLTWADVDLGRARALIRQTKIGEERWARLPPELVAAMANIQGEREPGAKVFRYSSRDTAAPQWDKAIRRAGIAPLSFHACRHGFASGLLDAGVNPKTVAVRGGWKNTQHVFQTYAHDVADEDVTDLLTGTRATQKPTARHKQLKSFRK